jgi:hypothetical protein
MPYQGVSTHFDGIRLRKCDQRVGGSEIADTLRDTDRVGLHRVLRGDAAVVLLQERYVGWIRRRVGLKGFDRRPDAEIRSVVILQWRRTSRVRRRRGHRRIVRCWGLRGRIRRPASSATACCKEHRECERTKSNR